MTYDEALKVLAILKGAYPNSYRDVTAQSAKATATVWAAQFANMPVNVVMIAVNKLISTNTYPPTINEVKERIRGLYFEVWEMLQDHKRATEGVRLSRDPDAEPTKFGKPLDARTVAQLKQILAIVEPMRTASKLEPSLGELLGGYENYLTGGNGTAQIE